MINREVIAQAAKRLEEKFQPEKIILIGSYARGTADEHSDVDLLVIGSFADNRRHWMAEMDRSLIGCGFARDIMILTPEEFKRDRLIPGTIARPAWQEGVVLYERH